MPSYAELAAQGAGFLAEPDGTRQHKNVRGHDLVGNVGPVVFLPAVLGHVGPDAVRNIMVNRAQHFYVHLVLLHDRLTDADEPFGVRHLRRFLQRAVDEERPQIREVPLALLAHLKLFLAEFHGANLLSPSLV